MQAETNGSGLARLSSIAVALVIVLAPLSTFAQRAGGGRDRVDHSADRFTVRVGSVLNTAIEELNAKNFEGARAAIGPLRLDRLSPYELGKVEQTLFHVAYGEGELAEARQHLLNAIESGGLTEQEIDAARNQVKRIDAGLAIAPAA